MWTVHETECYPMKFKVNKSRDKYEGSNSPDNFFSEKFEAQKEADRRNSNEAQGRNWWEDEL